jgi:hypothetical protein
MLRKSYQNSILGIKTKMIEWITHFESGMNLDQMQQVQMIALSDQIKNFVQHEKDKNQTILEIHNHFQAILVKKEEEILTLTKTLNQLERSNFQTVQKLNREHEETIKKMKTDLNKGVNVEQVNYLKNLYLQQKVFYEGELAKFRK